MLQNETPAPEFTLRTETGEQFSLASTRDKPVVLLFFRGKFCPTSKRYLIEWQEFSRKVHNLGAQLIGISYETPEVHAEMKERYDVRFPLLSDTNLEVSRQYGMYITNHHGEFDHCEPGIVILDKDGLVAYSLISSGPKGMPSPGDIAPILIYMFVHGGKY